MQIQAFGAGVVAIGGGFVAPNVLLGLERGLRQIAVSIEVFAADADVKQVLFDVFQQTGVVVMLLQGLVHAGGFVAAQVAGYGYRIFVLMGIGKDFFKCLSERIGMVGFKLFVECGNAVVETVVQYADMAAAIWGKVEAVDFFWRHARGTLQDFPLLHAYGRTLRGLRHGNALMVIISAHLSQC